MANTWSAITRLQIDEIEKLQRGFEEYDFDLDIPNWTTRITCFICSTFLLLTASFLRRIFYEIGNLKEILWKYVFVNSESFTWKLRLSASICFFFVSLSCLARELSGVKILNEFFCLKCSNSWKKNSKVH